MGSSSKRVTVGFRYFMGAHMGLVHGPVDCLVRMRVADKVIWTGSSTGSAITVDQPEIFGGKGAEGGISGTISFENGAPAQIPNTYLTGQLGTPIPAFRGVACVVLEHVYISANNPYLKPWSFTMTRTDVTTRGETQWYLAKARIPLLPDPRLTEVLDQDGVGTYNDDLIDDTDAVITITPSVTISSVGKWRVATLANNSLFSSNKNCVVELLIVGAGGGASSAGSGGGAGEVAVYEYAMQGGSHYRATIGVGGAEIDGGDSFVRIDGFDETHESAARAYGGHRTPLGSVRLTCAPGKGGEDKWSGSGAASPGYWRQSDSTDGLWGACSELLGGEGRCTSGGNSPASMIVGQSFGGSPLVATDIFAHAGRGGGGGFCSDGENGGSPSCASGCYPDGTWRGGNGGKGGEPILLSFDGTARAYSFGGSGIGGYTQTVGGGSFGTSAVSWRVTYGTRPGAGGDGWSGSQAGRNGEIKIRWREL